MRYVVLLLAILLSACAAKDSKALAPYSSATLTAGVGLGDIKLGEATLGWVVDRFGPGQVAVGVSDVDVWIELGFMMGEVRFIFGVSGQCYQDTDSPMTRLPVKPNIKALLQKYPSCRHLPLTEIYLTAKDTDPGKTFYKGSTHQGIRLWQHFVDIDVSPDTGIWVQLMSARQKLGYLDTVELLERTTAPPGVHLYYSETLNLDDMVVRQLWIFTPPD